MEFRRLTPADAEAFRQIRLHGLKEAPQVFSAAYELSATLPPLRRFSRSTSP
jgi:hypothetical protein